MADAQPLSLANGVEGQSVMPAQRLTFWTKNGTWLLGVRGVFAQEAPVIIVAQKTEIHAFLFLCHGRLKRVANARTCSLV